MAQKISTLILEVDLQCPMCSKKIKKVLCKLQDRENIQSVVYKEKENVVIVSGPFDPKRLSKKLCCKACKVIKDIHIEENKPPPTTPTTSTPKPECTYPMLYPYPYPYPYPTVWPFIPVCGCKGWCNCKSTTDQPPAPPPFIPVCGCRSTDEPPASVSKPSCAAPCYDGCRTCKFICEEEPSICSIM